ncbi:SDR family oxidoreductase [Halobacterium salinarum]|uniref:NAD(P)H-binding n=1 Tax=Halobacterium salinarum (strain ATCC 33171 / DSM 3754 / JCM 8978 / NBRC 102687 / NCIMB 764 / 91-R6) TaxID=2597657 RepID=A0A4D6GS47_HALS9|nr:SDR family oxidoreductase [Halobacterium salinarum]MDL0125071.1 SDR family oxidoreductase [Halobacterium salinarum]MDL0136539.1 SDR family oxidoreductase [Halobacterium salinarum]MDL0144515.1 SDR family oxidoreductase [Halobacterium salinarum]QCC44555.1 NAD-dependent epimerase/dehydratase-like protein [Halobacterium salinarum]TYO76398.1 NAD(P)H-binding [Halobacterium salinarum DSM 3754]
MDVLVAGAHGRVGQHLTERLADDGHHVRGMIRDPAQTDTIDGLGATPVVADLTDDVADAVAGCDGVVFAAGSRGEALDAVDRDGAIRLLSAAEDAAVDRFVMLSSMGADDPSRGPDDLRSYLAAKADADARLRESPVAHTIVRPGSLTTDAGTGRVTVADTLDPAAGSIPCADVAQTLAAALTAPAARDTTFEVLAGDTPVAEAVASVGD